MKRTRTRRPNLFLTELIAAILFFSLSSAVCVQIFAGSRQMAAETADRNQAAALVQSMAEAIRTGEEAPSGQILAYDAAWQRCGEADAAYRLTVAWTWDEESAGTSGTDSHAGQSGTAALSVCTADGTELFGLEIRRHFPHTLAEPEEDT